MISVKTKEQLELMRRAGAITRDTLRLLEDKARAGVSTAELDKAAYEYILNGNSDEARRSRSVSSLPLR